MIIDLIDGVVSYQTVSGEAADGEDGSHHLSQSLFRRWIQVAEASLQEGEGSHHKVSPSAELAKRVVSLRKTHAMTQQDLARALGISRPAVAFLETGRSSKAAKHIPRLAEIFQVPIDLFLHGMMEERVEVSLSTDERDLIELYRRLPPERKLGMQKYAEQQTRRVSKDGES